MRESSFKLRRDEDDDEDRVRVFWSCGACKVVVLMELWRRMVVGMAMIGGGNR